MQVLILFPVVLCTMLKAFNFWSLLLAWKICFSKAPLRIMTFILGVKIAAGKFSHCHFFAIASVQSFVTTTSNVKQWQNRKRCFKLTIVLHLLGKVWFYQAFSPLFYPIPSALPTLELYPFIIKLNQAKPISASHMPTGYNSWFWWWNITQC